MIQQVWVQNKNKTFKAIEKLQNKALKIMYFKSNLESAKPLYKDLKILKIRDLLTLLDLLITVNLCKLISLEIHLKTLVNTSRK